MSDNERTSIQVTKETQERLRNMGQKGESYEDIIKRILEERRRHQPRTPLDIT